MSTWLQRQGDKFKQATNWAGDVAEKAAPQGMKAPIRGLSNRANQLAGYATDPFYGYRKSKEVVDNTGSMEEDIANQIRNLETYQISPEAEQRLALLEQSSTDMRESGQEMTDVARMNAGMVEGPGSASALQDMRRSTAGQVQAIRQMGGGAGSLGAVSQVSVGEQRALQDFAKSNLAYRSQAETGLMNALRNQSSLESQAASLEAQGLEGMIAEKDKVYQSELNKDLTKIEALTTKLGMEQDRLYAKENKKRFLNVI